MDDVDDQAVGGGSERQRPGGYEQRHHMEQVRQVGRHVQGVVKGQHEHVPGQDGDVVPHQMLLQRRGRGQTSLIDDFTHAADHLQQTAGVRHSAVYSLETTNDLGLYFPDHNTCLCQRQKRTEECVQISFF